MSVAVEASLMVGLPLRKGGLQADRAISTGKLRTLLRFHTQPINQVVYLGPSGESSSQGDLILGGASRLDAFSGYPVRM